MTITDSLSGTAAARGVSASSLAIKAAQAGTDMVLLTGSEPSTKATYASLLLAAQNGAIPLATLQASSDRILALKATVASPVRDTTPPSVRAPVSRLYAPATLGSTTTPVRTSWSATDACGISGYTLERMVKGDPWSVKAPAQRDGDLDQTVAQSRIHLPLRGEGDRRCGQPKQLGVRPRHRRARDSAVEPRSDVPRTVDDTLLKRLFGRQHEVRHRCRCHGQLHVHRERCWLGHGHRTDPRLRQGVHRRCLHHDRPALLLDDRVAPDRVCRQLDQPGDAHDKIVVIGTAGHPRVDVDAFVRLVRP